MKLICTVFFILFGLISAIAQQNYDVSLIPKDLLPYASAVVRNEEVTYEVKDLDNVAYSIKKVITVLNKNGDDAAQVVVSYDKLTSVKYIRGLVYNEFGKVTGKIAEKDFNDVAAISNYSLFEDSRVKYFNPAVTTYPYTVEYEYEIRYKQSINFRDWMPISESNQAIEKSSYKFICNQAFNIRYKEFNIADKASVSTDAKGLKIYSWQVTNKKALKDEPYSPNWRNFLTRVMIAPDVFLYGNIRGAFTNWQQMGKFVNDKLLLKRDQISPETQAYIKNLIANVAEPKQKARKIYEYMQQKTHYISVQVGVGGYQPFLAADVDRLSYGDCKALVNYTQALFKVAGIESYYCIVKSGDEKVSLLPDFASMGQADHIILCMPFKGDTTWVDCTSQTAPFGYLGSFTADRTVLACTPEGGKLLHTPAYPSQSNLQVGKANFVIENDGTLKGDLDISYKGTQYDNPEELIGEPIAEQVKMLQKRYGAIGNLQIDRFNITQVKSLQPVTTETIKLNAYGFATTENNTLYFSLNPVNRFKRAPRDVRNRINPVYINSGYTDEDEVVYNIPAGYKSDMNPLSVSLDRPFGKFTATMVLKDDKLVFKRRLQILEGTYSKDTYRDLVDFYQAVADADSYTVMLVKK
jgi:transglutaminase-like putative cysteine protease